MRELTPQEAAKLFSGAEGESSLNNDVDVNKASGALRQYHSDDITYCASTMADDLNIRPIDANELILSSNRKRR